MKKLIFVRHGRAEDPSFEFSDFERSLTGKGKSICKTMAQKLKDKESTPGLMITSPAFRALETAYIFGKEFRIDLEKVVISSNLYYKMNYLFLQETLSTINEEIDTVTLFGHNPSFSEIANSLSKTGCDFIPKTGIVGISFNVNSWSEIRKNSGKIEYFIKPEKVL